MRFNDQILSFLKANQEFYKWSDLHLKESRKNIDDSLNMIMSVIINGISIQCFSNERVVELYRIAKECASVEFDNNQLLPNSLLKIKGIGANSEIFGERFGSIVNIIGRQSHLKSNSVYRLFSILTPITLSALYFNYRAEHYSLDDIAKLIKKITRGTTVSTEIKRDLNKLVEKRGSLGTNSYTYYENTNLNLDRVYIFFHKQFDRIFGKNLPEPN